MDVPLALLSSDPAVLKGNALLHAHLHRLELSPTLRSDLRGILVNAPVLVDAMMELAQSQRWLWL